MKIPAYVTAYALYTGRDILTEKKSFRRQVLVGELINAGIVRDHKDVTLTEAAMFAHP